MIRISRLVFVFIALLVAVFTLVFASAVVADDGSLAGNVKNEVLAFGVSTFGSLLLGAFQKHKTPLPNKTIPVTNPVVFGGATAAATGDPVMTLSAVAGSLAATGVHMLARRLFGR